MSSTIRDINGLVALVTGGASGLGEGTTRRLIRGGAFVVICDLPSSNGLKLAAEMGEKCAFAPADVTNEVEVEEALRLVVTKFQKLDVVVNCAGIGAMTPAYDFENDIPTSLQKFERVISINTSGTFNVIRLAVGIMRKNLPDKDGQRGVVINVSSVASLDGPKGQAAYSASKAAINGMTLCLAKDLGGEGIRCCTIAPGAFETPLMSKMDAKTRKYIEDKIPFPPRLGKADEFAHLVQSIIENPMLNGSVIRLDGALHLELP